MPIHGPKINTAFTFAMPVLAAGTRNWLANPSIESGDFFIAKSGGAEAALSTLPVVENNYWLRYALTATEMNASRITIRCHDAYGGEWDDTGETIYTTTAGSGSGVVLTASTSIAVDSVQLANEVGPLIASLLSSTLSFLTSDEIKQLRYALGIDGTKTATSGGVTDSIYSLVNALGFTGGNANAVVNSFSTAAQNSLKSLVFSALTDSGNTLSELSGAPSAAPTVGQVLALINMWIRNARTASSSAITLKNDGGSTVATQTVTDNGSLVSIGEMS